MRDASLSCLDISFRFGVGVQDLNSYCKFIESRARSAPIFAAVAKGAGSLVLLAATIVIIEISTIIL